MDSVSLILVRTANISPIIRIRNRPPFGTSLHPTRQLAETSNSPIVVLTFVFLVTKLLLRTIKKEFPDAWLMNHFRLKIRKGTKREKYQD